MASLKRYKNGTQFYIKVWIKELKTSCEYPTGLSNKTQAVSFMNKWLGPRGGCQEWIDEKLNQVNPFFVHIAVKQFLDHKAGDGETDPRTVKDYRLATSNLLEFCADKMSVTELGSTEQRGAVLYEMKRHLVHNLTPVTVNIRLRSIKACLRWMVKQNNIPLDKVPEIKMVKEKYRREELTETEYDGLMAYIDDDVIRSWIRFARFTGFRLSEIPKVYHGEDGNYHAVGKRGKKRSIIIRDWLLKDYALIQKTGYMTQHVSKAFTLAYRKYVLAQNPQYLPNGYSIDDIMDIGSRKSYRLIKPLLIDRYCVQHSKNADQLTPGEMRVAMRQVKTFHSLRHMYCTEVHDLTGDIEKTRVIMGHSSSSVTERYTHISQVGASGEIMDQMRQRAEA